MERHFRFNYPRKLLVVDEMWRKTLNKDRTKTQSYQIHVLAERCKGCGFCIEFCPQKTLIQSPEKNSHGYHLVFLEDGSRCTGCDLCTMVCPEFAICVAADEKKGKQD